jgi:hypothetical protein
MQVDAYQAASDAASFWEHVMAGVMIALSIADVVAFVIEWREHRKWTRAAKAEAIALVLFVALGLGDWHVMSLQESREQLAEQKAHAETAKVTENVDALKAALARRDEELAPFIKLSQAAYPDADLPTALGKLATDVTGLKGQLAEEEASNQAFKEVTRLSEEALAGSRDSYEKLSALGRDTSELGARARARVQYINDQLAYYEQPRGAVLAMDLSIPVNGKSVRLTELPTCSLILSLEEKDISNVTRFSVINDVSTKPVAEVDAGALGLLQHSQYLPAIAATTSILRRLHGHERPFMDVNGWTAYLQEHGASATAPSCYR